MGKWLLFAVMAFVLAETTLAGDRPPPLADFFLDAALDAAVEAKKGVVPKDLRRQALSLVGRDDLVLDHVYSPIAKPKCAPVLHKGAAVDPIAEIKKRLAKTGRIVIINEAHDDAQTRAFIADLLKPLHDTGFRVYAAETFFRSVGRRSPAWPRAADGTYSNEPVFGALLRKARSLEFDFVPYEPDDLPTPQSDDVGARIAVRESAQVRNIMDRIITPIPDARVLVHVGHHHVIEAPVVSKIGNKTEWMASRLKRASGIDPLTTDQTTFQSPLDKPVICTLASEIEKRRALTTDIAIGLPKPTIANGRPNWRRARGQLDVPIPVRLLKRNAWSIVEARYAAEPPDAVPADRILLAPGEHLPLLLKPGQYRVETWTREAGWGEALEILVPKARRS